MAKSAVNTAKKLIKKANKGRTDPWLVILDHRTHPQKAWKAVQHSNSRVVKPGHSSLQAWSSLNLNSLRVSKKKKGTYWPSMHSTIIEMLAIYNHWKRVIQCTFSPQTAPRSPGRRLLSRSRLMCNLTKCWEWVLSYQYRKEPDESSAWKKAKRLSTTQQSESFTRTETHRGEEKRGQTRESERSNNISKKWFLLGCLVNMLNDIRKYTSFT